jgi:hypothetical protein
VNELETWNGRAAWCLLYGAEIEKRARARVDRWRALERAIVTGRRELLAAAHQGLAAGFVAEHVREHRSGCLVLAGGVGEGKTTGAAWRCYTGTEHVLWLDASAVGRADHRRHRATLDQVAAAGIVILDDVGAAGSVGQYETPRVVEVLTRLSSTTKPSVVTMNLDKDVFGQAFDGEAHGRLVDRLTMRPNRFLEVPLSPVSRRAEATPPPDEPPPPEARAQVFLDALDRCRLTAQAYVLRDTFPDAVRFVARKLGATSDADLDARIAERDRLMAAALDLFAGEGEAARAAGGGT